MVSRESVNEVFLPDKEDCLEYLREQRWPEGVTCPHCESADTIKKGTTRKGAQRYRCQDCESISDGRVRFLVRDDLEGVDEDIAEYGDETVILCTDQYSIYDGIDEYDEIDGHLAINHDDHYVVGDAHTNSCENRHSFLRNWLRRFRGVSKHHLKGYLNFLGWVLNTDNWFEQILSTDFYR